MERDRGGDYLLRPVDGGDDVLVADDLMPDCMPTLKVAKIAIHREILITICSHKLSVHCLKTVKRLYLVNLRFLQQKTGIRN